MGSLNAKFQGSAIFPERYGSSWGVRGTLTSSITLEIVPEETQQLCGYPSS